MYFSYNTRQKSTDTIFLQDSQNQAPTYYALQVLQDNMIVPYEMKKCCKKYKKSKRCKKCPSN